MSNSAPTSGVVHEAIDERQYVRAKLTARVTLTEGDNQQIDCELRDISLGGMGLHCSETLTLNGIYKALIVLSIQGVDLNISERIAVVKQDGEAVGARFVDLEQERSSILRYIISAYMSGEMADVNGLFNVLQRENYIKERKKKYELTRTPRQRARAALGTGLFAVLGLASLLYTLSVIYGLMFTFPATQARVVSESHVISVPDNGVVKYLIGGEVTEVTQGQPLVSISSQLANRLTTANDLATLYNLSSAEANAILGLANIETVIASPCDCKLYFPEGRKEGFSYKGDALMHLLPAEAPMLVEANLPYMALENLAGVNRIQLQVFGEDDSVSGDIQRSFIDVETQQIQLIIKPVQPLARDSYLKPVWVEFSRGLSLFSGASEPSADGEDGA